MGDETSDKGSARHSIGVVADRTGLSVHQLRAWERRHGAVDPERTEGGHRLYTDNDLRRLTLLASLTRRGRRIGELAGLPTEELASLLERDRRSREPSGVEAGLEEGAGDLAGTRRAALESIEAFDTERLETLVRRSALRHGLPVFVRELVVPVLTEVGTRWHEGELGVAQEHLASGVFSRALQHMLEGAAPDRGAPALVAATPAGHRHEIGAMIAAAIAGSEGWRVIYLGADLPTAEIARAAREVGARVVALSLVYGSDGAPPEQEVDRIRRELPDTVELLLGGRAAPGVAGSLAGDGLQVVDDFDEFSRHLRDLKRAAGAAGGDSSLGGEGR